jgi:hypothetical protein
MPQPSPQHGAVAGAGLIQPLHEQPAATTTVGTNNLTSEYVTRMTSPLLQTERAKPNRGSHDARCRTTVAMSRCRRPRDDGEPLAPVFSCRFNWRGPARRAASTIGHLGDRCGTRIEVLAGKQAKGFGARFPAPYWSAPQNPFLWQNR